MYFVFTSQVTDEIEPGSESSNIMYSLSSSSAPPGLAGHFHIDPFTGDVSVVQPLDFDNISFSTANPGAISLTAMIRDHGRSPLSSTSTFTIILLVKISSTYLSLLFILFANFIIWITFFVKYRYMATDWIIDHTVVL